MSLDVSLFQDGKEVYSANITHNLGRMADEAGIYRCLWRPEEEGITHARQIIEPLERGLCRLVTQRSQFEQFNAENGWGSWENFVPWCANYLQACRDYPDATVRADR
jgi:hypothetical protein